MSAVLGNEILDMPPRRLLTRSEFERACEDGVYGPEEKLELIGGEVYQKMTQNSPHTSGVSALEETLRAVFAGQGYVRIRAPLALDEMSLPEPDVAVVSGSWRDYVTGHPSTALLLVEVADSSLAFDRTYKGSLYAKAGIPEYWILNLTDRILEVYRDPNPMTGQRFGYHYRTITRLSVTDIISPLSVPGAVIRIEDFLP